MKRYLLICALITLGTLIAGWLVSSHLPERVPVHWDMHGKVNGYSTRATAVLLMPAIMTGMTLLFAALPAISPRHFEIGPFLSTYLYIMVVIISMMAYFQAVILWAAFSPTLPITRAILGGICVLWILMANVMGKVKRNFFVGVRTPWTLASERVWNATHRFAAHLWVWCGLLGLLLAFFSSLPWAVFTLIIVSALVPVVYSFMYYKRLERQKEI